MGILHLANINFEWELETRSSLSLKEGFQTHPNFLQLQFLPLLFADKEDGVALTHLPPPGYLKSLEKLGFELPSLHLLDEENLTYDRVESWGWSLSVERWADQCNLLYAPPPFVTIRELASKIFALNPSNASASKAAQPPKILRTYCAKYDTGS